jgi:nitrogen-specific signal transduction histidine kinase
MIQKLLHNPVALKSVVLTIFCFALFLFALLLIRRLRRNISAEAQSLNSNHQNSSIIDVATYSGVVRQLRENQKELQQAREKDQQEATISTTIHETVLSNISCGVLFFDRLGTVRQANRAAKSLLGYASPFSFHIRDVFRNVSHVTWPQTGEQTNSAVPLIQGMQQALRDGVAALRARVDYRSPSGQKRVLGLTASAVQTKSGQILGLCCLIDDLTEITELAEQVRRSENFASLGEISAGLVNDFKNSLAVIQGHAQALLKEDSGSATRHYAEKIAGELDSLSRILSEFLEFAKIEKS